MNRIVRLAIGAAVGFTVGAIYDYRKQIRHPKSTYYAWRERREKFARAKQMKAEAEKNLEEFFKTVEAPEEIKTLAKEFTLNVIRSMKDKHLVELMEKNVLSPEKAYEMFFKGPMPHEFRNAAEGFKLKSVG